MEEYTKNELIQVLKASEDLDKFLYLLQEVRNEVSDVRVEIIGSEFDSIILRKSVIKVIEDLLLTPLKEKKEAIKPIIITDYT